MEQQSKFPSLLKKKPSHNGGKNGNGGDLVNHRLTELERRLEHTESKIDHLTNLSIEMKTNVEHIMNSLKSLDAGQKGMTRLVMGVLFTLLATIVASVIIKSFI